MLPNASSILRIRAAAVVICHLFVFNALSTLAADRPNILLIVADDLGFSDLEGGISSPCIVQWPAGLNRRDSIDHRASHLIDLMPTLLEVACATYPSQFGENNTAPLAGKSIWPLLRNEPVEQRELYFEHEGNRAVADGRWKLTALKGQDWELYDLQHDRTELVNVAAKHPDIVAKLDHSWSIWAEKNFVTPLPKDLGAAYLKPAK